MAEEIIKHLHIYEKRATRSKDWKSQIYRCVDPDCPHYIRAEFLPGKRARCHVCGEPIIIKKDKDSQVKNKTITGLCCSKSDEAIAYRKAQQSIEKILGLNKVEGVIETPAKGECTCEPGFVCPLHLKDVKPELEFNWPMDLLK